MNAAAPSRPFGFDTVFDGESTGGPPRRHYGSGAIEAIKAEAYAEGQSSAIARAETDAARALSEVAEATRQALTTLAAIAHEHRQGAARLAMAAARKVADAALEQFPQAPALAAFETLSREMEAQPRLLVFAAPEDAPRLEKALNEAAVRAGFEGAIVLKSDPGRARAAFQYDWGEGRAAYDPEAAAERVSAALEAALAAEGLHAEIHLPPANEAEPP